MTENARNDSHASICITIKATANGTVRNSLLWEKAGSCCFFSHASHLQWLAVGGWLVGWKGFNVTKFDHHGVMKGTNLLNNITNCELIKSKAVWGLVVRFPYPRAAGSMSVGRTRLEALLPIFTRFSIAWHGTFIMEISSYNCLQRLIYT